MSEKPATPAPTCVHCGAPIEEDARFCPACGGEQKTSQVDIPVESYVEADAQPMQSPTVDEYSEAVDNPVLSRLQRYWPYVAIAATVVLLAGGAYWLYTANKKFDGRPFNQVFPPVKKVVQVVDSAQIHISRFQSSTIAGGVNNRTYGDERVDLVNDRTLLCVIDEQDDLYHVQWIDEGDVQATIAKSACRVIEDGGIEEDIVHTIFDNSERERFGTWQSFCHRPDGNRLVVMQEISPFFGERIFLGTWQDGMYILYYSLQVMSLTYDALATGLQMDWDEETEMPKGVYGPDVSRDDPSAEQPIMDWCKLSEEQLAEIFHKEIVAGRHVMNVYTAKDLQMDAEGNLDDAGAYDDGSTVESSSEELGIQDSDYEFGELSGGTRYLPFGDIELCLPSDFGVTINHERTEAWFSFYKMSGHVWQFRPNDVVSAGGESVELSRAWQVFHYMNLCAVRDEGIKKVYEEYHTAGRLDASASDEYYSEIAECEGGGDLDKYCLMHGHWHAGKIYGAIVTGPSKYQLQQVQEALKSSR